MNISQHIDHEFYDEFIEDNFFDETPAMIKLADVTNINQFSENDDVEIDVSYDSLFGDIDFSEIGGPRSKISARTKPERNAQATRIGIKTSTKLKSRQSKTVSKVIVPDSRKVIVEGVSKFILSDNDKDNFVRNIGYKNGQKLRQLVFTFNNITAQDFEIELFNPSAPLDYLYATSQNLNDQIAVAGGTTSYSDVMFNILANPTRIYASKFVVSGPNITAQINQPLQVKNKNIEGSQLISPYNIQLDRDNMQFQNTIIYFDLEKMLDRPYIPDGMDVLKYKVLAGHTVTLGFYYSQISLKKFFYAEASASKTLM